MKRQLPRYFKFIGYAIPVLFIATISILKAAGSTLPDLLKGHPEYFFTVLSLGLLVVILSRDKFEDERTQKIRLNCFTFAFLFGVLQVITNSFGFMEDDNLYISAYIMSMMEGIFLLSFEVQKRFLA